MATTLKHYKILRTTLQRASSQTAMKAPTRLGRSVIFAAGMALSVICLVAVCRGAQLAEIADVLRHASRFHIGLTLFFYAVSIGGKAYRWRLLLPASRSALPLGRLASLILAGQTLNTWLMAHSGELTRAYLLGSRSEIGKATALGTIIVENALDSLFLLLALALLALILPLPAWLHTTSVLLAAALAGVLLLLIVAAGQWERVQAWSAALAARSPFGSHAMSAAVRAIGQVIQALRERRGRARLLLATGIVWLLATLTTWAALQAVSLSLPWYAPLFLLVVFQIGSVVPASPGKFGVFHYLAVQALAFFHVPQEPALSFAIVLHSIAYVLMGLAGAFCLWRENQALRQQTEWHDIQEPMP